MELLNYEAKALAKASKRMQFQKQQIEMNADSPEYNKTSKFSKKERGALFSLLLWALPFCAIAWQACLLLIEAYCGASGYGKFPAPSCCVTIHEIVYSGHFMSVFICIMLAASCLFAYVIRPFTSRNTMWRQVAYAAPLGLILMLFLPVSFRLIENSVYALMEVPSIMSALISQILYAALTYGAFTWLVGTFENGKNSIFKCSLALALSFACLCAASGALYWQKIVFFEGADMPAASTVILGGLLIFWILGAFDVSFEGLGFRMARSAAKRLLKADI